MKNAAESNADYEVFCDPAAKAMRELFELLVYWAIIWAIAVAAGWGCNALLDRFAPVQFSGWVGLISILCGLATAVAISWSFDGPSGARRRQQFRRVVRTYSYPALLLLGILGGWEWRDRRPPNPMQEAAREAAWKTCGQMPACIAQASLGFGGAIDPYIAPISVIDARGNRLVRYPE